MAFSLFFNQNATIFFYPKKKKKNHLLKNSNILFRKWKLLTICQVTEISTYIITIKTFVIYFAFFPPLTTSRNLLYESSVPKRAKYLLKEDILTELFLDRLIPVAILSGQIIDPVKVVFFCHIGSLGSKSRIKKKTFLPPRPIWWRWDAWIYSITWTKEKDAIQKIFAIWVKARDLRFYLECFHILFYTYKHIYMHTYRLLYRLFRYILVQKLALFVNIFV